MAATKMTLPLPVLPSDWNAPKDFRSISPLSAAIELGISPVGPHFLAHARRKRYKRTFSEDERIIAAEKQKNTSANNAAAADDDLPSEPEDPMMLAREPKDWKSQDHYAVLGLSALRWRATEEQIKKAHRKKVLKHHPDKKGHDDDRFFKCIQKATEVLLDPVKRRQYDSVDEHADVEPPSKKEAIGSKFYKHWAAVFAAEGRFSNIKPVPRFGDESSSKEEVEAFYNFFYHFDSWRSFEYLDEDVPDDNESRDQKRHIERKNTSRRKKNKTEDTARLRRLVDVCLAGDERIARFRKEDRANKNKKRNDKEAAEKKAAEEAKAKKEQEEQAKKEQEEREKTEKAEAKKVKEANAKAAKKNKRSIRAAVKEAGFFAHEGKPADEVQAVSDVDAIITALDHDGIAALMDKLEGGKKPEEIRKVFVDEYERLKSEGKVKAGACKSLE